MFEVRDFLFFLGADALERSELVELFRLVMFSLHGLAHTVGDARFLEGLVREDRHFDLERELTENLFWRSLLSFCRINS